MPTEQEAAALAILKKVSIFSSLSEQEFAFLTSHLLQRKYSSGEMIFSEGDVCIGLYMVQSGNVRIFKSSAGGCHVTYYFQPPNKRLTFPWSKGSKVEDIIAVEDEQNIKEWDPPDSGAGLIKARHPEFEMWNQGVHARSGVACADCHMPYMRQGGLKISDHQINSPLLKINRSCQTCHHFPEEELKARVEDIQDRLG